MSFLSDLAVGKQAETELVSTLSTEFPTFTDFAYNTSSKLAELKKYDISFTAPSGQYTIEVKNDLRSSQTGNFAFEILYKGKPSGINSTEATFFAVKSGESFYIFQTNELRKLLLETPHNWRQTDIINGTATVILVPIEDIKDMATVVPVQ